MLEIESLGQNGINRDADLEKRKREAEAIYGKDDDFEGDEDLGWDDFFAQADTFTITKLTAGVRDPNRVNVFLDGNFAFSLDVSQVIDLGVKVGQKINKDRLKQLQDASEFGKLYQRTLEWVLTRPHSVRETRNYLRRRKIKRQQLNRQREREEKRPLPEIQDEIAELVMDKLIEKKYLDDLRFAKFFIENRFVRKGVSHKRLRMELKQKGVSDENIKLAFSEVTRNEDEEILKMIKKKRAKYNDFKLVNYLVRQGFEFGRAKDAVEKSHQEEDSDSDW